MDVLADALGTMRSGPPGSARTDVRAPWGLRFPEITGAAFHVVLRGTCWLLSDAADPVPLATGDVVFLRRGSAHGLADNPASPLVDFAPRQGDAASPIGRVEIDGPGPRTVLLCGAYRLGDARPHPLMAELPDVVHLPARAAADRRTPHHLVELIADELDEPQPGRDGIVPALVDAMLLYILRAWVTDRSADTAAGGWAAALTDRAVGAALEGIHAEPARAWTVAALGGRGGLSRSAFSQRFTELVGTPPLAYLTWWRMTLAGRLLHDTDAPLHTIARRIGYTSEFAFARAFKREYGVAPGRYRRG